jgi:hypothetical protein
MEVKKNYGTAVKPEKGSGISALISPIISYRGFLQSDEYRVRWGCHLDC